MSLTDNNNQGAHSWRGAIRSQGTRREAIIVALRITAGNAGAAESSTSALEQLAQKLNEVVAAEANRFGSKEWLHAYRVLIAEVLRTQMLPKIDAAMIENILTGKG